MPATNYTWSIDEKPIFQVYGTKRKTSCNQHDGSLENEEEVEKKRRCTETRECVNEEMIDSMDVLPDNPSHHCSISNPATHHAQPQTQLGVVPHPHVVPHPQVVSQPHVVPMISYSISPQPTNMTPFNSRVPPLPGVVENSIGMECTGMDMCTDNLNNNNNNITHPGHLCQQQISQPYLQDQMFMDLNDELYSTTSWPLNPQTDAEYEAACSMVAAMEAEGGPDPNQYRIHHHHSSGAKDQLSSSKEQSHSIKPSWEVTQDGRHYVSDYY